MTNDYRQNSEVRAGAQRGDATIGLGFSAILLALLVQFSGCTGAENTVGRQTAVPGVYEVANLTDCSGDLGGYEQWVEWGDQAAELAPEQQFAPVAMVASTANRQAAIKLATEWAHDEGYLPCNVKMCGLVARNSLGNLIVHLYSPELIIGPDAIVVIGRSMTSVVDAGRWHSGCANWGG